MSDTGVYLDEHQEAVTNSFQQAAPAQHLNLDGKALIGPGLYRFQFISQGRTFRYARGARIPILLRVIGGAFDGAELQRYYNVRLDKQGVPQIPAGQSSHLRRESAAILGQLTTDLTGMAELPLVGRVRNTTTDSEGDPIAKRLHYSTVRKLFLATEEILDLLGYTQ